MAKLKLDLKVKGNVNKVKLPSFATRMVKRKGLKLVGEKKEKTKWQRQYKGRHKAKNLQKDVVNKLHWPKGSFL